MTAAKYNGSLNDISCQTPASGKEGHPSQRVPLPDRVKQKSEPLTGSLPFCYQLDWLTLNLAGNVPENEDGFHIQEFTFQAIPEYRTRHFNKAINIYYKYEKLAQLVYHPHNTKIFDIDSMQIKIDNHWFYKQGNHNLLFLCFDQLIQVMGWEVKSISRVDIALDFHDFNKATTWHGFVRNLQLDIIKNRSRSPTATIYKDRNAPAGVTGIHFGSASSAKHCKVYNKSFEMLSKPKPYIFDHWKEWGFDLSKDVYRYEMTLTADFFRDIQGGFEWQKIFNPAQLFRFLEKESKGIFSWVYDTGYSRTEYEKEFKTFDWLTIRHVPKAVMSYVRTAKSNLGTKITSAKNAMKAMFRMYVNRKQDLHSISSVCVTAAYYNLWNHLDRKIDDWLREMMPERHLMYDFNEGKLYEYINNWKRYGYGIKN